jgi:3-oxoacyl-[acyl-carrier-protein] synthase II
MPRVYVTAMAQISPFGRDAQGFRRKLFDGVSAIRDLRGSAVPIDFPAPYGALIDDLGPTQYLRDRELGEATRSILGALTVAENFVSLWRTPEKVDGIVWAGGDGTEFELHQKKSLLSSEALKLLTRGDAGVSLLADYLNLNGISFPSTEVISLNTACSGGLVALGHAFRRIRSGAWKRAIVGSASLRVSPYDQMSSYLLNVLATNAQNSTEACRPFALDRSGFVRGESAAIFLLESSACPIGNDPLAEILGFGQTNDAYRSTDGRPDGSSASLAIAQAMSEGGLLPKEIGYVCAHGTGTKLNDLLETMALKSALGRYAYGVSVSALKSQIGHSSSASGAIATYATIEMLKEQRVSPTLNLNCPDPECDLDYVPLKARQLDFQTALVNAFGFGGQNACLALRRT